MARVADPEKIKKIKEVTIELINEHSYSGVSISAIAKKAGVSTGYLYRHYTGKNELLDDIVETNLKTMKETLTNPTRTSRVEDILEELVSHVFDFAICNKEQIKFICSLFLEMHSLKESRGKIEREVENLYSTIIQVGKSTGEISQALTKEEVIIIISIPFQYVSFNIDEGKPEKFNRDQVKRIASICLKAMG